MACPGRGLLKSRSLRPTWVRRYPLLKLEGVGAAYGLVPVLQDISLEVNQGEAVAIVGANNAGKSTTLRTIAGLLKPTAGKITFKGQDLTRLGPQDIVNLGAGMGPGGGGGVP